MKVLVNYLIPYLNFEDYDANHLTNAQQTMYLDAFVAIFDSIRKDILQCICFIKLIPLTTHTCFRFTFEIPHIGKW